ncbi:hypothetical protein MTO96_047325 [Rhipicephalus appendiculatus]
MLAAGLAVTIPPTLPARRHPAPLGTPSLNQSQNAIAREARGESPPATEADARIVQGSSTALTASLESASRRSCNVGASLRTSRAFYSPLAAIAARISQLRTALNGALVRASFAKSV